LLDVLTLFVKDITINNFNQNDVGPVSEDDKDDGGMHYYLYRPPPKEIKKYIAKVGPNHG